MKQPHTEDQVVHTDDDQNTGNHKRRSASGARKPNEFGGTRTGTKNVENPSSDKAESVETGTDVDKVSGLDEADASQKVVAESDPVERAPERDERGRL